MALSVDPKRLDAMPVVQRTVPVKDMRVREARGVA
jgi:hypothetical protein